MTRAILAALLLSASIAAAHAFGLGGLGLRFGKLGASPVAGSVTPPPVYCANGNLLLVYSDSCQLMSQMVGN